MATRKLTFWDVSLKCTTCSGHGPQSTIVVSDDDAEPDTYDQVEDIDDQGETTGFFLSGMQKAAPYEGAEPRYWNDGMWRMEPEEGDAPITEEEIAAAVAKSRE